MLRDLVLLFFVYDCFLMEMKCRHMMGLLMVPHLCTDLEPVIKDVTPIVP